MNHTLTELQLLNCAIDSTDPYFFSKLQVNRDWFPTFQPAYDYITKYVREHAEMPTLTTVRAAVKAFDYAEYESADTLRKRLGDMLAKQEFSEWMKSVDTSVPFHKIGDVIQEKSMDLAVKYGTTTESASNWRVNGAARFANYVDRESNKRIALPSGFPEIDRAVTGKDGGVYVKGDYIVVYGATKRGKSHLTRKITTIPAVLAGFRVLDLCLENERAEIEFMLDSMTAADAGTLDVKIDGNMTPAGFDRRKLVYGYLDDEQRQEYEKWTGKFDDTNSSHGDYYIKTFEDPDMDTVNLEKIESLIDEYKPDIMLVDPIYLTSYPRTGDKSPGAGAQAMSRGLRRLATRKGVVMVVTVQATVEDGGAQEDDTELQVPPLKQVKTSKSLLEDGTLTFGIDSNKNGKAVIEIMLSRKGGAGTSVDLQYFPNYGIIRSIDEALRKQLDHTEATKLF